MLDSKYFAMLHNKTSNKILIVIIWQDKFEGSDWFFLGQDFATRCIFSFSKANKTSMARVPYNKLLTDLASASSTEEHWASVVFVR